MMSIAQYKKIIKSKKGMTLGELLIATVLVGIVMVGIVSIDYAMRSSKKNSSGISSSRLRASAQILQIARDGNLAVGDEINNGVYSYVVLPLQGICFRQDSGNPTVYTDDTWTCYSHRANGWLWRCTGIPEASMPANIDCNGSGFNETRGIRLDLASQANFFDVVYSGAGQLDYVEINLATRVTQGDPIDPITNPVNNYTTRIMPSGHSQ